MYARSTTIQAQPESVDAGIGYVRDEVMPVLMDMDGCTGLSMLADRGSGMCIATSAWRSEEAMQASDDGIRSMRERAAQMLGGSPDVESWEIAVIHRDHPTHEGACARVTWMQTEASQVDRGIETFKVGVLPMAEELQGWCSASLFVDRATGRACLTSTYDNADSMNRSREQAAQLRSRTVREMEGTILDVLEFDLVLAHLHVPETV